MRALIAAAAVALFLLGGCASTGDPRDPLEPMNRAVYKFNDGFDTLFARPAAEFYKAIVPDVFRLGVSNFFSNINDVIVALNNLLQGKVPEAIGDVGRIFVNTTLGILGIRDVATELGIPKNNEDFGQTLGRWGLRDGPYLVLPFLGPSSVRDTAGWVGDIYTSPLAYIEPVRDRNLIIGFRFVTVRADLLEASAILETAALDPYEFVRDAYLQRRRNLVYDGNPPEDKDHFQPTGEPKADVKAKNGAKAEPKPEGKPDSKPESKPVSGDPAAPGEAASAGSSSPEAALPKQPRFTRVWLPENR
jgi:phospholipid-binding lipoprotein MlaA